MPAVQKLDLYPSKNRVVTILAVLFLFLNPFSQAFSSLTEGVNLYLDESDEEYGLIMSMFSPRTSNPIQYPSFIDASKILVLGDGFAKKWTQNAEYFQSILPLSTDIYKTDIECPRHLDGKSQKNLHFKKVDHNQQFPFEDGAFDIISMPYGLCICHRAPVTCGGIDFGALKDGLFRTLAMTSGKSSNEQQYQGPFHFLSEVARVLNAGNSKSVAFLHGPHSGKKYPELIPYEKRSLHTLRDLIPKLEKTFPFLDFKLVFFRNSTDSIFEGVYIRIRSPAIVGP